MYNYILVLQTTIVSMRLMFSMGCTTSPRSPSLASSLQTWTRTSKAPPVNQVRVGQVLQCTDHYMWGVTGAPVIKNVVNCVSIGVQITQMVHKRMGLKPNPRKSTSSMKFNFFETRKYNISVFKHLKFKCFSV